MKTFAPISKKFFLILSGLIVLIPSFLLAYSFLYAQTDTSEAGPNGELPTYTQIFSQLFFGNSTTNAQEILLRLQNNLITFFTNGTERMRITSTGNVGIGTTNPQAKLDIAGNIKIGNSGGACTTLNRGSMRYNASTDALEYCSATNTWEKSGGGNNLTCTTKSVSFKSNEKTLFCDPGWIRTGCSSVNGDSKNDDCHFGARPEGENGCRFFKGWCDWGAPTVYGYTYCCKME